MPAWLRTTLAEEPEQFDLHVEGVRVRSYLWGKPGGTPVVLVHGGLSHAHWWDHIAPLLPGRQVVAIDLSGHGESGNRENYNARQWAREIVAVAADAVRGVITVDTRFNDQAYPHRDKPSRVFASIEDGIRDFNPVHASLGCAVPPSLLRHLTEQSLGHAGDGWRWKRDDRYHVEHVPIRDLLPQVRTPLAVVRTEHGLVTEDMAAEMRGLVPAPVVDVEIPAAGHNPMLEQPLALVGVLRTLFTAWFPAVLTEGAPHVTP